MATVRVFSAFLIACLCLLLTGLTDAQDASQDEENGLREIRVSALNVGEEFWFQVEGEKGHNPTIRLHPGERVEVTLDNEASVGHNIRFGSPIDREMPIQEPGRQDTMTFRVPEDADGESSYWCQPHQSLGMQGGVVFGPEEQGAPGAAWGGAFGVLGALAAGVGLLWTHRLRM